MSLLQQLDAIVWKNVPNEACRLAKAAAGPYSVLQDLFPYLPDIKAKLWYNPDREVASFNYPLDVDSDKVASWHIALKQVPGVEHVEHGPWYQPSDSEPHILVKKALENQQVFGPIASAFQMKPNAVNNLWGGPNPLTSTIAGGLLGAGLGYGGGWLAEQFMPDEHFEPGRLRKTTALMGGLAGAVPGLWWGVDNMRAHPDPERRGFGAWTSSYPWNSGRTVTASDSRYQLIKEGLAKELSDDVKELNERWEKYAWESGAAFAPMIPVDQFNRTIWNDLRGSGGFTAPPIAAATTGLVQAASLSQGGANFVSPMDIARIGMGMGTGYLSGLVVGKTLGALAGLRPESQQQLQNTGAWAGMLANILPIIFRG